MKTKEIAQQWEETFRDECPEVSDEYAVGFGVAMATIAEVHPDKDVRDQVIEGDIGTPSRDWYRAWTRFINRNGVRLTKRAVENGSDDFMIVDKMMAFYVCGYGTMRDFVGVRGGPPFDPKRFAWKN